MDNLFSFSLGYFDLLSAVTPASEVPVMSSRGIITLSNMVIAQSLLFGILITIRRVWKKMTKLSDISLIILSLIIINTLMFIFVKTKGFYFFPIRYLVPLAAMMIAFFGVFLSSFGPRSARIYKTMIAILLVVLLISNVSSFIRYTGDTIDDQKALAQTLSAYEAELVYTPDQIVTGNLRVLDTDKTFHSIVIGEDSYSGILGKDQHIIGGYKRYLEPGEFRGETIILAAEDDFYMIPSELRDNFVFVEFSGFREWNIYLAPDNYLN